MTSANWLFTLDLLNLMVSKEQQVRRSNMNRDAWLQSDFQPNGTSPRKQLVLAFPTINSALEYVNNNLANKIEGVIISILNSFHIEGRR